MLRWNGTMNGVIRGRGSGGGENRKGKEKVLIVRVKHYWIFLISFDKYPVLVREEGKKLNEYIELRLAVRDKNCKYSIYEKLYKKVEIKIIIYFAVSVKLSIVGEKISSLYPTNPYIGYLECHRTIATVECLCGAKSMKIIQDAHPIRFGGNHGQCQERSPCAPVFTINPRINL